MLLDSEMLTRAEQYVLQRYGTDCRAELWQNLGYPDGALFRIEETDPSVAYVGAVMAFFIYRDDGRIRQFDHGDIGVAADYKPPADAADQDLVSTFQRLCFTRVMLGP